MKTGSEHFAVNIPKSWLRGFNHDSEKKNLAIGTGGCGGCFVGSRSALFRICSRGSVCRNPSLSLIHI